MIIFVTIKYLINILKNKKVDTNIFVTPENNNETKKIIPITYEIKKN